MGRVSDNAMFPRYLETIVTSMESGLYLYLAHPDLIFGSYAEFDDNAKWLSRELCKEANRLHMPLEYNMYGVKKGRKPGTLGYPCDEFWRIAAEENVRAVVGLDAHMPEMFLTEDTESAFAHLKEMGITVYEDPFDALW
jgi:histidinol-phosphatase (PHP family)